MAKIDRDENAAPELVDYDTAVLIMADIAGRAVWSTPKVLAQWVHAIRKYGGTPKTD